MRARTHRNRCRLPPESRPAPDAEPRLQRSVLFPIPQRCPDEHATDDHGGEEDEQENNNDRSGNVHASKSYPPKRIPVRPRSPQVRKEKLAPDRRIGRPLRGARGACEGVRMSQS
jgi:hypothetical protein